MMLLLDLTSVLALLVLHLQVSRSNEPGCCFDAHQGFSEMIVSGPNMFSNVLAEARREESALANSEDLHNDTIQLHQ